MLVVVTTDGAQTVEMTTVWMQCPKQERVALGWLEGVDAQPALISVMVVIGVDHNKSNHIIIYT